MRVVARHTDAQIEAARAFNWSAFDVVRGYGIGLRQMQAVLDVWGLAVTELMAAEAARLPQGLVELTPDVRVVARGTASVAQEPTAAPSAVSESPAPASPSPASTSSSPGPNPVSGRIESLDCGSDDRSSSLNVDYPVDAPGHANSQAAAHALADEDELPRDQYTERAAQGSLGQPVFEYLDSDRRVVAYVTVGQWNGDTWMASGLTARQSAYATG